jgi:hypothetical protein
LNFVWLQHEEEAPYVKQHFSLADTCAFFEFAGDLTPAQTLDVLCTQNYVLIDVRSEKDKDKSGIPRLPSSAKNKMVAIP